VKSPKDKRILLINGKPIDYALARMPAEGSFKGNLAAGATGVGQPLSDRDRYLCEQIAPTLKAKGLMFVGLDVIGDYITEINVTVQLAFVSWILNLILILPPPYSMPLKRG